MDKPRTGNTTMSTFRIVVITFMVTAIMAFAVWYFFIFEKQIKIVPPVEMTEVRQGNIAVEIVITGELIPVKSNVVEVPESFFSDFSVNEIEIMTILPEYSKVENGDIIANLDNSVYEAYKSKIENEIAEIEKNIKEIPQDSSKQLKDVKLALENARLDLEIRKISVEQSLFDPVSAHERMKLEFSKSTLAYENALANYHERRKSLHEKYAGYPVQLEKLKTEENSRLPALRQALKIVSLHSGVLIYAKNADRTKKVAGSILTPRSRVVAEIEDISQLVSQCFLSEDYFSEIREGQNINVYLKSNALDTETQISKVNRKIETVDGRKVFSIGSIINNEEHVLSPGQTTINKISLNSLEDVLYLPNSSILEEGLKSFVFLSGGVRHEIKCKNVNEEFTQIISGLAAGQMVYLNAAAAVSK